MKDGEVRSRDESPPSRTDEGRGVRLPMKVRIGQSVLGVALTAMGVWILPYQLARGDVILSAVGAGLIGIGLWTFIASAVLGRRFKSLERLIELLSELT